MFILENFCLSLLDCCWNKMIKPLRTCLQYFVYQKNMSAFLHKSIVNAQKQTSPTEVWGDRCFWRRSNQGQFTANACCEIHVQIWGFIAHLCDQRKEGFRKQWLRDAESMPRRSCFFVVVVVLITHTEHNPLLASPCLFFSPSACAHASPVSFWLAHLPSTTPLLLYFFFSSSFLPVSPSPPPASLKRVTLLIS